MKRFARYSDNGELILQAHQLGHVRGLVLDATYGKGTWWSCAEGLTEVTGVIGMDLVPHKARRAPVAVHGSFLAPPFRPRSIRTVFYDPRYKLNGTPTPDPDGPDERYGADDPRPWREIQAELVAGVSALAPLVAAGGRLLAKCQDQVSSGRLRMQTTPMIAAAEAEGLELVDYALFEGGREQPEGRRKKHLESNFSTLLIFGRPPILLRPL